MKTTIKHNAPRVWAWEVTDGARGFGGVTTTRANVRALVRSSKRALAALVVATIAACGARPVRRTLPSVVVRGARERRAVGDRSVRHVPRHAGMPGRQGAAVKRLPVCPRCLGETPGIPAGDPGHPHPGPFTRDVCEKCQRAIDQANAYGRDARFTPGQ